MDFDDVLEELGELGKYQIITYILICIPVLFGAANSLSYVFTAGIPNYRCLIPECEDSNSTSYDVPWMHWAIPSQDSQQILDAKSHYCDKFTVNQTLIHNETCFKDLFTKQIETCKNWVFDDSEHTIVNDWNLTCFENQWKLSFVGTTHFAGIIVGSGLFGILADRYGRKKMFIVCTIIMSLTGCAQVISPNYLTFIVFMFLNAMGTAGVYPLAFIIGVEMVGKKKRELTGIVLNYFYAIGEAIVAPLAYYSKDWVLLQLIVSGPAILFVGYYWVIPESVRWLLANEKREKAKSIVCKAAKINQVTLSESLLDSFNDDLSEKGTSEEEAGTKVWTVIKTILGSRKLVVRLVIIYIIWAVNAFVFYGLSVNSTSISGNKYINFALVSLIEIPGYTIAWISIRTLGRRMSLIGSLLLCGLTCTLTIFVPPDMTWAIITLFLMGKLGITSSFGVAYVHTAEMLPTIVRSGGVGSASTMARFGALLAPFVPILGIYAKSLPMLLFGGVAVAAGILALKLPETLGHKLPESVKEAEEL